MPTNRRAGHAGKSNYHGRADCNEFSLGIEIVNPGRMTRASKYEALAWWGERFDIEGYPIEEMQTPEHGAGLWMHYTPEQISALELLLEALFRDIPTLTDITTHWYVSPGRKVDPNPLFPLERLRAKILGRDDPRDAALAARAETLNDLEMVAVEAKGGLNMRAWPSFNNNIITQIPHYEVVPVIKRGHFNHLPWLCVQYAGREGWIVAQYTIPVTPN